MGRISAVIQVRDAPNMNKGSGNIGGNCKQGSGDAEFILLDDLLDIRLYRKSIVFCLG